MQALKNYTLLVQMCVEDKPESQQTGTLLNAQKGKRRSVKLGVVSKLDWSGLSKHFLNGVL